MRARREAYSFAVVMLTIAVAATAIVSCSGSGESSNGDLCQQCGDSDGPCDSAGTEASGDDRPEGCTTDPCLVKLQCVRKVDSGQRRCYPINPTTNQLDPFYKCDGSRPEAVLTPTPTSTAPTPTATPAASNEVDVDITITADVEGNDLPQSFTATVTYPMEKGSFLLEGAEDCDEEEGVTFADDGKGMLVITFTGDAAEPVPDIVVSCTFHQLEDQTLTMADLPPSSNTDGVKVVPEIL